MKDIHHNYKKHLSQQTLLEALKMICALKNCELSSNTLPILAILPPLEYILHTKQNGALSKQAQPTKASTHSSNILILTY